DEPRLVPPAPPSGRLEGDARGAEALPQGAVRVDAAVTGAALPDALGAAEAIGEAANSAGDLVDLGLAEGGEGSVGQAPPVARGSFVEAARERPVDVIAHAAADAVELVGEGVAEGLASFVAEGFAKHVADPAERRGSLREVE